MQVGGSNIALLVGRGPRTPVHDAEAAGAAVVKLIAVEGQRDSGSCSPGQVHGVRIVL